MASSGTLLCIHRDFSQMSMLRQNGYDLLTATNGHDGLRLSMSQAVDAIVLEHQLGLLDGLAVASEIKQFQPKIPIVMLVESLELPNGALNSVDAVVAKSDGPHFLCAAVDFVVNIKPRHHLDRKANGHSVRGPHLSPPRPSHETGRPEIVATALEDYARPFSPEVWQSILNGTVQF